MVVNLLLLKCSKIWLLSIWTHVNGDGQVGHDGRRRCLRCLGVLAIVRLNEKLIKFTCIFWFWKMHTLNEMGLVWTTKSPKWANNPPTLNRGLTTPHLEKGANNPPTLKSVLITPNPKKGANNPQFFLNSSIFCIMQLQNVFKVRTVKQQHVGGQTEL